MSRFFISDIHLFHNLMLKHRGYVSFEEMHQDIINHWNKVVHKGSTVYVVGDFTFGEFEESKNILNKLNGRKILIKGNHDRKTKRQLKTKDWLDMGFFDVMDEDIVKIHSEKENKKIEFHLKHYPYSWHWLKKLYTQIFGKEIKRTYNQLYPKWTEMWHIHGHHHGGCLVHDNEINVSWETLNGKPISEHEILKIREKQLSKSKILRFVERVLGRQLKGPKDYHEK